VSKSKNRIQAVGESLSSVVESKTYEVFKRRSPQRGR